MKNSCVTLLLFLTTLTAYSQIERFTTKWALNKRPGYSALGFKAISGAVASQNNAGEMGGIPDLLMSFNGQSNLKVIPAINLVGSYLYQSDASKSQFGLLLTGKVFTGFTQLDTSSRINANNLWIHDASTFGININTGLSYIGKQSKHWYHGFMAKVSLSYLHKSTPVRDSLGGFLDKDFVGMLHTKIGIEYSPVTIADEKLRFVIYANYNYLTPLTNVQKFEDFYNHHPKSINFHFADFGLRIPFTAIDNDKSNLTLYVDANFITYTSSIKKLYETKDKIIPVLRFGVNQTFGF